jgi:DUF4097 and DUF4098 domain-containing protein YvlB
VVERIAGPPPTVSFEDGVLEVRYDHASTVWRRSRAVVELTVPPPTDLVVATAAAPVTATGLGGRLSVRTAAGDVVLDGLAGATVVGTAAGGVVCREPTGRLQVDTVAGDVAVVGASTAGLSVKTVAGEVTVDLEPQPGGEYEVGTVAGAVAVRLTGGVGARVDTRRLGWREASTIGSGGADLVVRTVAGRVMVVEGERETVDR